MSLNLLPSDGIEGETYRRIRVEIVLRKGVKMSHEELLMSCEVHIMGKVEPFSYREEDEHSDEDDHEACGHKH